MNLILTRTEATQDGIFSELTDENGTHVCVTLEHAYDSGEGNGSYAPKLKPGTYQCVRGQHRLAKMKLPFTTFEITGVPGHTNILFHVGNYNDDSEGCILLGKMTTYLENHKCITHSKDTFASFMDMQNKVDEFTLTVKESN